MIWDIIGWIGVALIVLGAIMDLIASIGMHRFRNFYLRLHAATVGMIGGAFYPLIGLGLLSLSLEYLGITRYYIAGISFVSALFVLLTAPVGSHVLARAAHRAGIKPEPINVDRLQEDMERGVMEE